VARVVAWGTGAAAGACCELLLLLSFGTTLLLCVGALPCEIVCVAAAVVVGCCGTPWYATSPYVAPKANVVSAASARVIRVRRFIPLLVLIGCLLQPNTTLYQATGGMLRGD
jgi:hypothetical protein